MLSIRKERLEKAGEQLVPLMEQHARELAPTIGLLPAVDYDYMRHLEFAGLLVLFVAREEDRPVGYIIWIVSGTNLQFKGVTTAAQGPWFVLPEKRNSKVGLALFRQSLNELKALGIRLVEPHHWGEPRLGEWFTRLGAKPTQTAFILNLDGVI